VVFSGGVRVLLGNGDGTLQTTHTGYLAGAFPSSVAARDFDGDGWADLAVANAGSDDVSVLLNAADDAAVFYASAPEGVPAGRPFDLAVFALSGTGLLAHGYRGTVALVSTDAAGTLPEPYRFRLEDRSIAIFPGGGALRTMGPQVLLALDLETVSAFGFAFVDVLAPYSGGAPGAGLDLFVAEVLGDGPKSARR